MRQRENPKKPKPRKPHASKKTASGNYKQSASVWRKDDPPACPYPTNTDNATRSPLRASRRSALNLCQGQQHRQGDAQQHAADEHSTRGARRVAAVRISGGKRYRIRCKGRRLAPTRARRSARRTRRRAAWSDGHRWGGRMAGLRRVTMNGGRGDTPDRGGDWLTKSLTYLLTGHGLLFYVRVTHVFDPANQGTRDGTST